MNIHYMDDKSNKNFLQSSRTRSIISKLPSISVALSVPYSDLVETWPSPSHCFPCSLSMLYSISHQVYLRTRRWGEYLKIPTPFSEWNSCFHSCQIISPPMHSPSPSLVLKACLRSTRLGIPSSSTSVISGWLHHTCEQPLQIPSLSVLYLSHLLTLQTPTPTVTTWTLSLTLPPPI